MKAAEYLEEVEKRIESFLYPLNVENLRSYLNGFRNGYILSKDNLRFGDTIPIWKYVVESRGWKVNSFGIEREMREMGKSEEEIFNEILQIEIEVWRYLEADKSKLKKS